MRRDSLMGSSSVFSRATRSHDVVNRVLPLTLTEEVALQAKLAAGSQTAKAALSCRGVNLSTLLRIFWHSSLERHVSLRMCVLKAALMYICYGIQG
jgi:hypothetical protein